MRTTTLGHGGPQVSRAGLGLMGMSGTYGPADEKESIAVPRRGHHPADRHQAPGPAA